MAPKVQVPMDFGVKYLGSPSHGNLKFRLESGEEILANSVIISYNSPVIDSLTTDLFQTTVDVDDFAKEAVQCFVEASYSGELKKVSKSNFRDVNKMAHVFEVSWITERCLGYFKLLTEDVTEDNYENQLYVFEEAMFMLITLKKRSFVEAVIERFSMLINCSHFFVTRYLSDLSLCSTKHLDVIIGMTEKQSYILMEVLINHLEIEKNKVCSDLNSRYLLEKVSFSDCYSTHKSLYQALFECLENIEGPTKEDFNLLLGLYKQADQTLCSTRGSLKSIKYVKIPNLFHTFETINDFPDLKALLDFLVESPSVTNSYIFFDAIYCFLLSKRETDGSSGVVLPENAVEMLVGAMSKHSWKPLALDYLDGKNETWLAGLTNKIIETQKLTTNDNYHRILSIREYDPDDFFLNEHDLKFHFRHASNTDCYRKGECGFILHVTAASEEEEDSFNIQLVVDPDLYPNDIHFHSESLPLINHMHFVFYIDDKYKLNCPVTWYGKPCRDKSQKYWLWGAHRFYEHGSAYSPLKVNYGAIWHHGSNVKITPVVYYFG